MSWKDVLVLPFNDIEASRALLNAHKDALAGILIDPVPSRIGCIPIHPDYAAMLREFATASRTVLIFDEVASFRVDYHGAQSMVGVTPDLTTFGKIIGGGMPVGAVGGREEVMAVFDPTAGPPRASHGGTFNGNPMTMAAGAAAMRLLTAERMQALNANGDYAREKIDAAFARAGIDGQATGAGSLVKIHVNRRRLRNHRDVYAGPQEAQTADALTPESTGPGVYPWF